jgi:hypothetical protein
VSLRNFAIGLGEEELDLAMRRVQRVLQEEPHDVRSGHVETDRAQMFRAPLDSLDEGGREAKRKLSCDLFTAHAQLLTVDLSPTWTAGVVSVSCIFRAIVVGAA